MLNDIDLAWLAGIFEGEGAATRNADGRGKIQFDNTDRTMIDAVATALGYGKERVHEYPYSRSAISISSAKGYASRGVSYRLYVLDPEIIKRLYPFVRSREKREKLELCFPFLRR